MQTPGIAQVVEFIVCMLVIMGIAYRRDVVAWIVARVNREGRPVATRNTERV